MSESSPDRLRLDVALIHHPVLGREGNEITTSLTPIDLHDISRTCKTYGVEKYYVVHPHQTMQAIAQRVRDYWEQGAGKAYEHNRQVAFQLVEVVSSLDEALFDAKARRGQRPMLVTTSARSQEQQAVNCEGLRQQLRESGNSAMLVFGTGWGLAPGIMKRSDVLLEPIRLASAFNHLSVRSAVAITLDRIVGEGD